VPYPPDKGDRIRTYYTLRFLAQRHRIDLACLADEPVGEETREVLNDLCARVAIVPNQSRLRWARAGWAVLSGGVASIAAFRSSELARTLEIWAGDTSYDLALASASSVAPYLRLPSLHGVPGVVDLVDVDSQKWFDYAASVRGLRRWVYRREGEALRRYEQELASWARGVLLVSDAEAKLFTNIAPDATIRTVTNGVNLEYFVPGPGEPRPASCVFVGALDYHPNVDAVCWFTSQIWPKVLQTSPRATFRVVGRKPVPAVLALADQPGVEVVGQVADVRPEVRAAEVVIAPLRIARGLQNKVLEALALARPVVSGAPALAGFLPGLEPPVVRADTSDEWVAAIAGLFADPVRRAKLSSAGREYVERHYAWDQCLLPLQEVIEQSARPPVSDRSSAPVAAS